MCNIHHRSATRWQSNRRLLSSPVDETRDLALLLLEGFASSLQGNNAAMAID